MLGNILECIKNDVCRYALTIDPIIFDSLVKQFWSTATLRPLELGPPAILATIDATPYTITEDSVRGQLQLADDGGIDDLPIADIYSGMDNLGYVTEGKLTFYKNKFSPQWRRKFNWSSYIFKGMVSNIGNAKMFLMYPRFLQTILAIETSNTRPYKVFKLSSKLFANMKLNFEGQPMPLLAAMLSEACEGAGVDAPGIPQVIPDPIPEPMPETDQPPDHLTAPPRQQPSDPIALVFEHGQMAQEGEATNRPPIENQLNQKVKIIRSDNGTEFKNRVMLEFCGEKANPRFKGGCGVIDIDVRTEDGFWQDLMVVSSTEATRKAAVSEKIATKKTHSPTKSSSTPISKSVDDIMTFRKVKSGNIEAISPSANHEEEVFSDADDDEMPEIRIYDKCKEDQMRTRSPEDESWVEAMQEELLQFKLQQVWVLVDLPNGAKVIGTKWVYRNKKDERGVVCQKTKQGLVTPKTSHLNAVKRIFKYLKGKPNLGVWYPRESPFDLEAFSDSDYGGSNLDRKSTTGGCQFLGQRLISWQCKKQTIVATSTTEAEYVAAANCLCGPSVMSAIASTKEDGSLEISATIDTIRYTISEASIRDSLQLDDATGITMLPNDDLFAGYGTQIGYLNMDLLPFGNFFTPQLADI
ncbi:hypothetical protein Tco_0002029 [Tanacetum coccineum]